MKNPNTQDLVSHLLSANCIKYGKFKLKSGADSDYYIDLRESTDNQLLFKLIVEILGTKIREICDPTDNIAIVGVPYGVVPIAAAVAYQIGATYHAVRKEVKAYGRETDKIDSDSRRFIVIEDVMSTGSSIKETIVKKLVDKNVTDVIVVADREAGGAENLKRSCPNVKVHSILTVKDILFKK